MQSKATTVAQYLAELPDDRRAALSAVRKVILDNLDSGFAEAMQYGMIGYAVPHSVFPAGYHCDPKQPLPYAALASQKNYMALYLMTVYSGPLAEWFRKELAKTGKKLDMGKACIRFRKLEDLPLELIGETIRRVPAKAYIEHYLSALGNRVRGKPASRGSAAKAKPRAASGRGTAKKPSAGRKTR